MALAFSGMVATSNRFLNQFGFIMIVGVLLDTFVVRVVLVPAMLSVGGWLNWWPRAMADVADRDEDATRGARATAEASDSTGKPAV